METSLHRELLDSENQRYKAMCERDLGALRDILSDYLMFCHTSGRVDSKDTFIDMIADPSRRYLIYECSDTRVLELGPSSAALLGQGHVVSLLPGGDLQEYWTAFMNVWVRRDDQWQMIAWLATRVAAPTATER